MDWIQDKTLIPEQTWVQYIEQLEQESTPATKEDVSKALADAIVSRIPKKRFGIFLSGGVDSSLIALLCKQQDADFMCYVVGLEDADDVLVAQQLAKDLDLPLKTKIITLEELEVLFKRAAVIVPEPDVLAVGVGAVVIAAADMAKEDGITTVFGGLGAEEIFAGYGRHVTSDDVHTECWRGLKAMWQQDFLRDHALATTLEINVLTPFLDETLIRTTMGVAGEHKIQGDVRKVILREIAEELGLPKEIAWRKKKAAQYGSRFDQALEKIAKQKGLRKPQYIATLLPE